MEVYDQTGDLNGQTTYRLFKLIPPPDFVKAAGFAEVRGDGDMSRAAYADPVRLQFPGHTKAAVWVSTLFWLHNHDAMDPAYAEHVRRGLAKAAAWHGVAGACQALCESWEKLAGAAAAEVAIDDADYALVVTLPDGTRGRHYPLRNGDEVKTAAAYLENWRDKLGDWDDRVAMARNILRKAAAYGVALDNAAFLERQAGHGGCEPEDAAAMLWDRVRRVGDTRNPTPLQVQLAKTAAACLECGGYLDPDRLTDLAGLVYRYDGLHGVREYTDALPRPEDVLFRYTPKTAAAYMDDHVRLTSGSVYRLADVRRLKLADVRDVFGDDLAGELGDGLTISLLKAADVLPHLPRPDAGLLDRLLAAAGVEPVEKQAEAAEEAPRAFWETLAGCRG